MCASEVKREEDSRALIDLVLASLALDQLGGLSEILKRIAQSVDAYGCILWEVAPGSDLEASPPTGHLFVLAHWFPDDKIYAVHDLQLGSVTGYAVLNEKFQNIDDVRNDSRVSNEHPFIMMSGIEVMCSAPIRFLDQTRGAVNLYRNTSRPFTEDEVERIKQYASLVPALYKTIKDEVSFSLIQNVNSILQKAALHGGDALPPKRGVHSTIQALCELVSKRFQCMEVSVFLPDYIDSPGSYNLVGTTWPWPERIKKNSYQKSDRGLTAWVLAHGRPMRIFDLAHFKRDKKLIQSEYRKITWKDSLKIETAVRMFLDLGSESPLPPLSFMAAPISIGNQVLGVIRCCAATQGPYYFGKSALDLLQIIAGQISHYWNNLLIRREMQEENESWRALIDSVGKLNSFVQHELSEDNPSENRIFSQALKVTRSVINSGEIMDIRLVDEAANELYFAEVHGPAWSQGTRDEIEVRKGRRFPTMGSPPSSAGAFVFQKRELYEIPDVETDQYYSETFPNTRRMLIAPIKVEKDVFGVLDIRGTSKGSFPKHSKAIAELLGQQLGLYHYLAATITRLRGVEVELNHLVKTQNQVFEDLNHQLRSPIVQAHARTQRLLKDHSSSETVQTNLLAIRGLCGKARRVAMNTGLFAALARQEKVPVKLSRLQPDNLRKLLIELSIDNRLL